MRTNRDRPGGVMPSPPPRSQIDDLHSRSPNSGRPNASGLSDTIQPFLVSGGAAHWQFREDLAPPNTVYDPAPAGAQLIASVYIPPGRNGFLKQLNVGPFKPSVLADVFDAGGIQGPYTPITAGPFSGDVTPNVAWQTQLGASLGDEANVQKIIYSKVWQTPFGWETYVDPDSPFEATPVATWTWQLTILKGSIDQLRRDRNIPQFSFLDQASWFLAENVPVPMGPVWNAYPGGLPGSPVGLQFPPQRVQSPPGSPLHLHLFIPEDSTICLFARWAQIPTTLQIMGTNVALDGTVGFFGGVLRQDAFILGPSYGSLLGYTQPASSQATVDNAQHGWGG